MCTHFKWGLSENILMFIGALELKEFEVLSEQAQKMEDICNEKKQVESKLQNISK